MADLLAGEQMQIFICRLDGGDQIADFASQNANFY
jgi:hypothetical protein